MADGILIDPGSGVTVLTDETGAGHAQGVKLAVSANADATLIPADATNGLSVDVTRVQGNVTVIQSTAASLKVDPSDVTSPVSDAGGSLTVDAPVATPVFVRLSDGSAAISALPITDNGGNISIDDGGGSVTVDGTVAATQSGTWNIATLTTITNPVPITDNGGDISIDDGGNSITIDGTVTADQGTAAASSGAWPVKLTDGTLDATLTTVSADNALDVNIVQTVGPTSIQDKTAFTEGTTEVMPVGAVFNDTITGDPAEDQITTFRITSKKGLHTNLRNDSGTEIGTTTTPVATKSDHEGRTIYAKTLTFSASQTGITLLTPSSGKKFIVVSLHLKFTGAGRMTVFDGSDSSTTVLLEGTYAAEDIVAYEPPGGRISALADNVLKYSTGTGAAGEIVAYGYDSE